MRFTRISATSRAATGAPALLALLLVGPAIAHEVPSDVTLQLMVRPLGERLHVLARVPLEALQEMNFPTTGPGYLDLDAARQSGMLADAAMRWLAPNLELFGAGNRLPDLRLVAVRVSLPSDGSFSSYDQALAHITGAPLSDDIQIPWRQALLDALFETSIPSDNIELSIRPTPARLGSQVLTALRFLPPGGGVRAFELHGDPGLVRLDPRWHHAAARFVGSGFVHILDGRDHLLFLLCLVIPLRRIRELVWVVTAFTLAHSVTLVGSAYGLAPDALWFPPLIEVLIAGSIVYMALENIVGARLRRRWLFAFGFGLVHGFGFSFVLRDSLQFAGSHLLLSLLSFNVGVELGQLLAILLMVPLLDLLFRFVVAERIGTVVLSALVAHTAWHWMIDRGAILGEYRIGGSMIGSMPSAVLLWGAPIVVAVALVVRILVARRASQPRDVGARPSAEVGG